MKKIVFLYILLFPLFTFSQSVNGKVIDSSTKEPLIGVSIWTGSSFTISNNFGEFFVEFNTKSIRLNSVGYEPKEVILMGNSELKVELNPSVTLLKEVIISNYGEKLLTKAISKLKSNSYYGKSFYREKIILADSVVSFREIFFNLYSNNADTYKTSISNARFITKKAKYVRSNSAYFMHTLSRSRTGGKSPICSNFNDFYNVFVDEIQEDSLVKLKCVPINDIGAHCNVYINAKNYEIELFEIESYLLPNFDENGYLLKDLNLKSKVYYSNGKVSHINLTMSGIFSFAGVPSQKKQVVESTMMMYDYSEKPSSRKLKDVDKFEDSVQEMLKVKYDSRFWANNVIVKRTQLEEEIIKELESGGSTTNIK